MNFACESGNEKLVERLEKAVKGGRVSHAYIFEGADSLDKTAFAKSFIKGILCPVNSGENCGRCSICAKVDRDNHEDVLYIHREERSVRDLAIIHMQEKLNMKPLGERNIAVICDSDAMTPRAQNRLLKTLEEPQGGAVIILLSENMENLAQTIRSRCVKFRLNDFADTGRSEGRKLQIGETAENVISMCIRRAPFYRVRGLIYDEKYSRDESLALLDEAELIFRDMATGGRPEMPPVEFEYIYKSVHMIEEARRKLKRGYSTEYAINNLILKIGG